jgi:hypothetical protein
VRRPARCAQGLSGNPLIEEERPEQPVRIIRTLLVGTDKAPLRVDLSVAAVTLTVTGVGENAAFQRRELRADVTTHRSA